MIYNKRIKEINKEEKNDTYCWNFSVVFRSLVYWLIINFKWSQKKKINNKLIYLFDLLRIIYIEINHFGFCVFFFTFPPSPPPSLFIKLNCKISLRLILILPYFPLDIWFLNPRLVSSTFDLVRNHLILLQ